MLQNIYIKLIDVIYSKWISDSFLTQPLCLFRCNSHIVKPITHLFVVLLYFYMIVGILNFYINNRAI